MIYNSNIHFQTNIKLSIMIRQSATAMFMLGLLSSSGADNLSCKYSKILENNEDKDETDQLQLERTFSTSNWFCKYQDKINENNIRKHLETWLSIMSDDNNDIFTLRFDDLEPFESCETPHIDIQMGYLANRKMFKSMKLP